MAQTASRLYEGVGGEVGATEAWAWVWMGRVGESDILRTKQQKTHEACISAIFRILADATA